MTATLKTARITSTSDQGTFPAALAALEASVAEVSGLTLDSNYTGRQFAFIDSNDNLTDSVGWVIPLTGVGVGELASGTAGESQVFGSVVYEKSDGKMWKGLANATATSTGLLSIALGTYPAGGAGSYLRRGYFTDSALTLTVGGLVYIDPTTAGSFTQTIPPTAGMVVRIIGYAYSATTIYFCPDTSWVLRS